MRTTPQLPDVNASGDSTSESDNTLSTKNEVGFQHTGCQLTSLQDTSLGQADSRIEARNFYKSNASIGFETRQKASFNVMSAEEKLLSRSLKVPCKRRDQKSLMQDSDGDFSSRRDNHSTDSVCLHSDKYNDGASCGAGTPNNLVQEVEVADGVTLSGSEGLCSDSEDKQLEFKKCSRYLETSNHVLTSSSSDKFQDGVEKIFKTNKRDESDEARAPSLPTSPESDVEEDVKVCDICGDAGREDLLAVCSRCSDGAEHTYCMREMLDKVPEVDWLCEECKHNELLDARQLDQSKKIGSHERNKPLGRTCSLTPDLSLKLDNKDPVCDRLRLRNPSLNRQSSSKICGERMDSYSTAKKQILESSVGFPTMSSPSRMAVLSKDIPFKILDNIKGKPCNQISTGTDIREFSENAHSPTTNSSHFVKGTYPAHLIDNLLLIKACQQNGKVSDDVLQKHSVDAKEGIGKSIGPIGKSVSFKGLGRSSLIEPKVKMLPANCAPFQDLKGPKHGKDRTSYERKNTMKLDNSLPGQIAADSTNRSSGVSDGISTLSVTSTRDYKSVQTDVKLPNMSNHAGHLTQKSSDIMRNLGEATKLSSTGIVGSTHVSGTVETKFNHLNANDGLAVSSSRPVDGSHNADGGQGSQIEKAPEKFSGCSRQGLNSGLVSGSRRRLPLDSSALKSKDVMPGENKLKAAIEAAMQKKQDILKKNKIPEKPVELSISNKQSNHGGDADSNHVRDPKSEEAMHEGDMDLHDINLDSSIQKPVIGEKPIKLYPADFENSLAGESVLTVSAIPEQESIWQGGFEIHRNGKPPDMRGGFQAHMSLFASGKVHEMVGKFPKKIIFNEVPRPCAWPAQFKELGPQEDNIALYFFAKDSESYLRSYKILVDYMMKHDLALRGNINGVELLVFPSNHLPHESKCWNTLYFIWGVFRGRRPRILDDRFSFGKCEISVPDKAVLHKAVTSAENPFLLEPAPEQLSVSGSDHNLVSRCEASVIEGSSLQLRASLANGDCYKEEYSVGKTCMNSAIGAGNPKKRPKNHDTILREACPETGGAALREQCQGKHRRIVDLQKLTAEINQDKSLPSEVTLDQQNCFQPLKLPLVGKQEGDTFVDSVNLQVLDSENDHVSRLKYDNGVKEEKKCLVTMQESRLMELEKDIDKKEDTNCLLNSGVKLSEGYVDINISVDDNRVRYSPKRHSHEGSDTAVPVTGKKRPWVDKIDMPEDAFSKSTNFSGCNLYTLEAQMADVSSKSHVDSCGEADNEKPSAITQWSSEECFFLDNVKREDGSFPLEVASSENGDRDCLHGEAPNLELALGVKKKQAREGALRFDRKDPDEVASSIVEDGDASASLSLSLGFPFLDKESMARSPSPPATVALNQRVNTSLLLFRGSPGK
ncbi:hypothetical protein KSS87_023651 [Heliosperma pusillum]|nr:hypothetical protein KSS87_023651 [Heliosperma pusillum]